MALPATTLGPSVVGPHRKGKGRRTWGRGHRMQNEQFGIFSGQTGAPLITRPAEPHGREAKQSENGPKSKSRQVRRRYNHQLYLAEPYELRFIQGFTSGADAWSGKKESSRLEFLKSEKSPKGSPCHRRDRKTGEQ